MRLTQTERADRIRLLVEHNHLREVRGRSSFVGLNSGVIIDVTDSKDVLSLGFYSVDDGSFSLVEQQLQGFKGFQNWSEAGLSTEAIKILPIDNTTINRSACGFKLSHDDLAALDSELLMRLPELIISDLKKLGVQTELRCSGCSVSPASTVALLNNSFAPNCSPCWEQLRDSAPGHLVPIRQSIRWPRALLVLTGITALYCNAWIAMCVWGRARPGTLYFFMLAPLLLGGLLSHFVTRAAGGSNLLLRIAMAVSTIVGTLVVRIGVLWNVLLQNQFDPVLRDVIETYFRFVIPNQPDVECFLIWLPAGAGAALAFRSSRMIENVEIR